jgi:uncharacterized membrane protein YcaP (DUF421 family)
MFSLIVPWWELVVRGAVIFLSVLLLLRLSGKRQVGELTPFDLVLLLLISEAASPALTNDDKSWTAAVIVIGTMLLLNALIRAEGCNRPSQIEYAVLETSGKISVKKMTD